MTSTTVRPLVSFAFPTVIVLNVALGLTRLVESPNRYTSPSYVGAKAAMPIRAWGALFLSLGIALWLARKLSARMTGEHRLLPTQLAGGLSAFVWLLWAALSAISAHLSQPPRQSSYGGAELYTGVAAITALATLLTSRAALDVLSLLRRR